VPSPDYVRFATHYGFRPDFCEAADPESKGIVEHLVGYAKSDLVVPQALAAGNDAARARCAEVNAAVHSEICAVPAERLAREAELLAALPSLRPSIGAAVAVSRKVDRLSCVRFGSARYSVPTRLIGSTVEPFPSGSHLQLRQRVGYCRTACRSSMRQPRTCEPRLRLYGRRPARNHNTAAR